MLFIWQILAVRRSALVRCLGFSQEALMDDSKLSRPVKLREAHTHSDQTRCGFALDGSSRNVCKNTNNHSG